MSSDARAVVERMFDAFKRKDLEEAVATVSDDTVWTHHGSQKLQSLHFVGKEGVRKFFHTNFTAMQVAYFKVRDTIAAGDKVVALGEESFTMAGQEGEFTQKWVQVYTVRDGLITRMEEYATSAAEADYARIS